MEDKNVKTKGGTFIDGDANAGRDFIGRDIIQSKTTNISGHVLIPLFAILIIGIIAAIAIIRFDGKQSQPIVPVTPQIGLIGAIPTNMISAEHAEAQTENFPNSQIQSSTVSIATPTTVYTVAPINTPFAQEAANMTPIVLPTPVPGEAQIIGAVFDPSDFNGYDAAGLILSKLENKLSSRNDLIRTVKYPYVVNYDVQARNLACETGDRIVIWGSSHIQNVVINFTTCHDPSAIRRNYYVVAEPRDGKISLNDLEHDVAFLVLYVLARLYYLQGHIEDAQSTVDLAIRSMDDRVPEGLEHAYLLRGNTYLIAENYEEALADFSVALSIEPMLVEARYNRALVLYQLSDKKGALKELDTLLEDDSSYRNAYIFRGAIYSESETQDGLQKAVTDFSKVIDSSSTKHGAVFDSLFNRAIAYIRLENFESAEADLERMLGVRHDCAPVYKEDIIQKEPGDSDLWCGQAANVLASLYIESLDTNYEEGVRLAQMALVKIEMPYYRSFIYDTLARGYEKMGQCDLALQTAEEGLAIQPDASFLNEMLAYLQKRC